MIQTNNKVKRINKTVARKLYNEGKTIELLPCKVRYNNFWITPYPISNLSGETFDSILTNYGWYNLCSELGNYIAFYLP